MTTVLIAAVAIYLVVAGILYAKMLIMSKTDEHMKYSNRLVNSLKWPYVLIIFAMAICILLTTDNED